MREIITEAEKQLYKQNGFLHVPELISSEQVKAVRSDFEDIHARMAANVPPYVSIAWEDQAGPNGIRYVRQLMHSEQVSPTLNQILRSEALLDRVAVLMGPQISLNHSKLLPKEAGIGAAVPWHQDYAYWKTADNLPLMINCQIAIDPMTLENGCLEFVPGSHRWGLQEHENHEEAFGRFLPGRYYKREDGVAVEMQPGDGCFFPALVIHGTAANTTGQPRWANTFAYNVTGNGVRKDREMLR